MMVDSMEKSGDFKSQRTRIMTMPGRRLNSLESRYPALTQSCLSIVDQAIVSGTSFVSAAIIGRLTTPDELGLYYLVLSIVIIASAVQDAAVSAPLMVYFRPRKGRELEEYSGSAWIQHFVLSAMSIIVLLVIIAVLFAIGQSKMLPGLWVLLGAAPLILLRQAVRRFAFATLHLKSAIALDIAVAAVQLGGLALFGLVGSLSLATIFAVMGGACALACIGLCLTDPPKARFVRERFGPDWRLNWNFAKWSLRSYLVGSTTPYLMLWILGLTVETSAAGVFGACLTLVGVAHVLLTGVDNVLTQQAAHVFATHGAQGLRRLLLRIGAMLVLALGGVSLFIAVTGDWLPVIVFGSHFQGTGGILLALALSATVSSLGLVAGNGLWAVDRPRTNFVGDIYCMLTTLTMSVLLIPRFGVLGAALTNLSGMTAGAVARIIVLHRYLHRAAMDSCVSPPQFPINANGPNVSIQATAVATATIDLQMTTCPEVVS
jgi:O-antigen/teichoic acid export membrane protein